MLKSIIKPILFVLIVLFLNACVSTGKNVLESGKNVINSAKEKVFDSSEKDNEVGLSLKEDNANSGMGPWG